MNRPLNLAFAGTPQFAVPTLERLAGAGFNIHLILTQPDKPRGRGLDVSCSPVKQRAIQFGIPIAQPASIKNNEELKAQLAAIHPDAIVVVGYGRIIPQWMIDLPALGNINLHASLLPKYRGAAPIQWAIANGDALTGVTTMRIDAGLDTGDILLQYEVPIGAADTSVSLAPRLAEIGADLMVATLQGLAEARIRPRAQDETQASHAPMLKKEDGRIDFTRPASVAYNRLRGFQPWPGAYSWFRGKHLQVHSAKPVEPSPRLALAPGELRFEEKTLIVSCGANTALQLIEVQLEGRKRTSALDFAHGYRLNSGERLGS